MAQQGLKRNPKNPKNGFLPFFNWNLLPIN